MSRQQIIYRFISTNANINSKEEKNRGPGEGKGGKGSKKTKSAKEEVVVHPDVFPLAKMHAKKFLLNKTPS